MNGWPAIAAARQREVARVPFSAGGEVVGSVARAHLAALAAWPQWLEAGLAGVRLLAPHAERDTAFAQMNAALRTQGLIVAWRDEPFALFSPATGAVLATFERASARFWGTLTLGAHCNGYVAGADGRPTHVWIARRSPTKATDPGLLDNLVGGGVPLGQTPRETVVREGWEEAGLTGAQMQAVKTGRVIRLDRDVPEGRQLEDLHVFDLALPAGCTPVNQDGEVQSLQCLPVETAAEHASGNKMTVDAALASLDFLLRHRLLPSGAHEALDRRMAGLWVA
jgi:8-oxo-dGTP pyrophosphatase MutT (NUDIX family)